MTVSTGDNDVMRIARNVSRKLERRYRFRVEPGELLGPAWQGASRSAKRPVTAAYREAIDYLRSRDGYMRRSKGRAIRATSQASQSPQSDDAIAGVLAPAERPSLLALWCDAADQRDTWGWRKRVWGYLFAVECLTYSEIGRAFECSQSLVSKELGQVIPTKLARDAGNRRKAVAA